MAEQYYRVKVQWPIPYFMEGILGSDVHVDSSIYDSRFYTAATDLRSVYLDIQAHIAKNYAPEGLNEYEEPDDEFGRPKVEPGVTLQAYSCMRPAVDFEVEVINDPDQVNLIDRAIEQRDLIRSISQLMFLGMVPVPDSLKKPMFVLGGVVADLDRAIARVLRPFYHDGDFELLKDLVEKGDELVHELQTHAHSVIRQVKGA